MSAAPLGRMSSRSRRASSSSSSAVFGPKSSVNVVAAPNDISVPRETRRSAHSGSSLRTGYGSASTHRAGIGRFPGMPHGQ